MTGRIDSRRSVLDLLARAGWDVEDWDAAREAGARVDLDSEAEYVGPSLALRLEFPATGRHVAFQLSRLDGEPVLRLQLHPRGDTTPVLAEIVAVQNTLDEDNHASLVKSLIPLCDPLLVETDNGVFRLS